MIKNERLSGWRNTKTGEEKISIAAPALTEKAFSGIHLISPEIFPLIHQEGKFSIVDVYLELAASHLILGFDHSGSKLVMWAERNRLRLRKNYFLKKSHIIIPVS